MVGQHMGFRINYPLFFKGDGTVLSSMKVCHRFYYVTDSIYVWIKE